MQKRVLALLVVLCMVLGLVPAVTATEVASGTCGDNLTWMLTDDGTLTISGEGEMDDYSQGGPRSPWNSHRSSINTIVISNGVTSIGNSAFYGCTSLISVILPDSLTNIGYNAFEMCKNLPSINLPDSLTTLKAYAFRDCDELVSITIPDQITAINTETFMDCRNLTSVILPESLTYIGYYAFGISGLTEIDIPSGATHVDRTAFYWTPWENKLSGGYIIVGDHVLLGYFDDFPLEGTAVIPDGVKYIASNAFASSGNITNVILPDTLLEIGHWAFENQNLETVTIPASVTHIDGGAFIACSNLKSVYFVGSAPSMEEDIFKSDTLTAFYPSNDPTWTEDVLLDYMGNTRWVGYHEFDDVASSVFYFTPVVWASTSGITNGLTADTFGPTATCNRAQVVTFLWRAAGSPEPTSTENPFADVQAGSFYEKPVLWAVEHNITNGSDATHFNPNGVCNRAQVVTFLYRAFGSPAVENADNPFTDVPAGSFYEAPVLWAVENGITNGLSATTFGPNESCNRAQVVTFLYRAYTD